MKDIIWCGGKSSLYTDAPIGVFDSGSGGLTVVKHIRKALPNESLVYFADTQNFPYGPKSPATIRGLCARASEFLRNKGVKAIVVACNTATAIGMAAIKSEFPGPVLGVIEAGAISAIETGGTKCRVGLVGTEAVIRSDAYDRELRRLGLERPLVKRACSEIIQRAETGQPLLPSDRSSVLKCAEVFRKESTDILILGCTHLPLLIYHWQEVLPLVKLVDPAQKVASMARDVLYSKGILSRQAGKVSHVFYYSGEGDALGRNLAMVIGELDNCTIKAAYGG